MGRIFILWALALTLGAAPALAQMVEVDDSDQTPPVREAPTGGKATGKEKAKEYFQQRKKPAATTHQAPPAGPTPRYLAVHMGTFFQGQSYRWGESDERGVGKFNGGVTYRLGEWVNAMDFSLRMEYTHYELNDGTAKKLSFGTLLSFPDSNSRFPLYFGGGAGAGLFIQQIRSKSPVALDWQLFAGVRFLDVFEKIGFMVEAGLKNHVFLLSDGQFNGVFINVGTVFAF